MTAIPAVSPLAGDSRLLLPDRVVAYGAVVLASFFGLISYGQFQPGARDGAFGDALNYIRMSERTFAPVDDPFALRLLTPWLAQQGARLSGLHPDTVWLALTFAATVAAVLVTYEFMRGPLSVGSHTSLFAALLLSVTFYYASYNYGNFWLVDPVNNLVFVLAIYFAFRGMLVPFVAVLIIGSFNKETALLMAPLFPLLAWARAGRVRDRAVAVGVAGAAAVAVVYLAFRVWASGQVGPNGVHLDASPAELARVVLASRHGQEHLAVYGVFHFLWIVFAYSLYRRYQRTGMRDGLLLASAYVLGCALLGRLQATDTERVFVMVAPLLVAGVAVLVDGWQAGTVRPWVWVLGIVYAALSLRWVTGDLAVLVDIGALVGFVLLLQQAERAGTRPRGGGGAEHAGLPTTDIGPPAAVTDPSRRV